MATSSLPSSTIVHPLGTCRLFSWALIDHKAPGILYGYWTLQSDTLNPYNLAQTYLLIFIFQIMWICFQFLQILLNNHSWTNLVLWLMLDWSAIGDPRILYLNLTCLQKHSSEKPFSIKLLLYPPSERVFLLWFFLHLELLYFVDLWNAILHLFDSICLLYLYSELQKGRNHIFLAYYCFPRR